MLLFTPHELASQGEHVWSRCDGVPPRISESNGLLSYFVLSAEMNGVTESATPFPTHRLPNGTKPTEVLRNHVKRQPIVVQ